MGKINQMQKNILAFFALIVFFVTTLAPISAITIEEIDSTNMIHRNTLIFDNTITSNISYQRISGSSVSNTKIDELNRLVVEFPNNAQPDDSFNIIYDYVGTLNGEEVGAILTVSNIVYGDIYTESMDNSLPQAIYFNPAIWKGVNQFKIQSCDYHLNFFKRGNTNQIILASGAYMTFGSLNYYDGMPETVAPLTSISKAYTLPKSNSSVTTNVIHEVINGLDCFHATTNDGFTDELGHPNFPANAVSFDYTGNIGFRIITKMGSLWFTFDTAPITLSTPVPPTKTVSNTKLPSGEGQILTYKVAQKAHILGIDAYIRYNSFQMTDTLDEKIDYVSANVTDSLGNTLSSSQCSISYNQDTRTVIATFSPSFLSTMPLNGEYYYLNITTKTNDKFTSAVKNNAQTIINNYPSTTNEVETIPMFKVVTEVINGTITPTINNITSGENKTISYSPNPGYMIQSITVDGVTQNITTFKDSYAFNNINANHHIKVVYEPIPEKILTITKIWKDWDNAYGVRPTNLRIDILQNGIRYSDVTLTSANIIDGDTNKWQVKASVPQYDKYRNEYTYTIKEDTENENIKYFYETPKYNQNTLTVTNRATYVPEVDPDNTPFYSITINKSIINKENQTATAEDFLNLKLNKNNTYQFPIVLKELNKTVNKVNNKLVESYSGYSGNIYQGIVSNKGNLIFNDIPAGKYEILELNTQYFNFIDIEKLNSSTGATFTKENGKYYITISGLTAKDENISVKITNKIEPSRSYNEEDKENNYFNKQINY